MKQVSPLSAKRVQQRLAGEWLHAAVLGLDDGLVTTLVTIMAISSTAARSLLVVMLGVILASAISMALGGYAAARTERDIARRAGDLEQIARIHPIAQGAQTGGAFLIGGLAPLIPVALHLPAVQWWSYGAAALVSLLFGTAKARYSQQNVFTGALFFLAIVSAGTLAGVLIGWLLHA